MTSSVLPVVAGQSPSDDHLQSAVAAYLARYRGLSREHTASDLRVFLDWCAERGVDPLAARRAHLELYVRWCQESSSVQAIDGVPSHFGGLRLLPDPRDRRAA
jgi:hypothetical protein